MELSTSISKEMFELILADFARSPTLGRWKRIVLQLDNAGWHGPENLAVPWLASRLSTRHSPELQPAEHLWTFVDEPLSTTYFETLEASIWPSAIAASPSHNKLNDPRQHLVPLVARQSLIRTNQPETV